MRAALLGATALSLFSAPFTIGDAAAKVGVTSATDGDPLGKPPQAAERVLRIGIDVQANELITTNANDRAHLLFLDGSSLTVGPNAQLTIDKFVFDPSTKTGELAINASKGVLRLVGGKISKSSPITITTPSSTIGIRGGITILDVKARQTESTFVFGKDMTVRGGSQTQVATRPGSMIVTNFGSPPGMPTILAQGALTAQLGALEGRRAPQGGGGGGGRNPDQVAQSSGLSGVNSSQSVRIIAPGVPDNFGSGPGPNNRNPNDTTLTALSNSNQGVQSQTAIQQQQQQQQQQQLQQQAAAPTPPLPPPPTSIPTAFPGGGDTGQSPTSQPPVPNLPQTGGATYAGTMVGLVNGHTISTGSYQSTWNFSQRAGTFNATFQGANFQGGIAGGSRGTFSTPTAIQSNNQPRQLQVNGGFFGPSGQPDYQAGNFGITSTNSGNYSAVGAFIGKKQ
ncbi:MAG TPA: FecR domain-containing protein [Reyranella sp.]|nr:FecR domain-containing protein [Reyranella sp.]